MILLDTNVVVAVLRKRSTAVRSRLSEALDQPDPVLVSSITLFELWYGVARGNRPEQEAETLRNFLAGRIEVAPFEAEDAVSAGLLHGALKTMGKPIGPYDVLIAGQALRLGAVLITANVSEFSRVEGLQWRDWSVEV